MRNTTRSRTIAILAPVVLSLGLAGCSSDSESAGPLQINDPLLEARSFAATSVTEAGAERTLVGPDPVTVSIIDGGISAEAGCNTLFGGAAIDAGVLTLDGPLGSTMMACPPELMDQDQWLAQFLSSGPTIAATDTELTLTSGDTVMVLAPIETIGLYDTPLPEAGDAEAVMALCAELVSEGATVAEATARGEAAGHVLRIVMQDGEPLPATMDANPGRLNLEVEGDIVTGCTAG